MSEVWITVAVLAVTTSIIRASGPVLVGGRELHPRLFGVIALFAPALLAALVVTETLGRPGRRERAKAAGGRCQSGLDRGGPGRPPQRGD
ncbi:MAG: AzlD domain-containing protein, partial [Solirubrobacterales bacterium]